MSISEETFHAFVDGILPAGERARVGAMIAADPALSARLVKQQELAGAARASFSADLEQPVPPAWLELIAGAGVKHAGSVVSLDGRRARRPNMWSSWHMGLAAAASLALGLVVGRPDGPDSLLEERDGVLLASASLSDALDGARSGVPVQIDDGRALNVQLSMRSAAGDFCREALVNAGADRGSHLLACRARSGWHVVGLARAAPAEVGYATASGDTPLEPVISSLGGEILDATGERSAIAARWRQLESE